jgi:hypothetical protein
MTSSPTNCYRPRNTGARFSTNALTPPFCVLGFLADALRERFELQPGAQIHVLIVIDRPLGELDRHGRAPFLLSGRTSLSLDRVFVFLPEDRVIQR